MEMPAKDKHTKFEIITANANLTDHTSIQGQQKTWTDIIFGATDEQGNPKRGGITYKGIEGDVYTRNGTSYATVTAGPINGNKNYKLSEFVIRNSSPVGLTNAHIDISIPDGFDCHNLLTDLSNFPNPSKVTYTVTYADKTTKTATGSTNLLRNTTSSIRKVHISIPKLPLGYQTSNNNNSDLELQPDEYDTGLVAMGHVANSYDDGSYIKDGTKFETTMTVSADGTGENHSHSTQTYGIPQGKVIVGAYAKQQNTDPGYLDNSDQTGLRIDMRIIDENLDHATFYFVLPDNATIAHTNQWPTGWPWYSSANKPPRVFTANGKTVVAVSYDGNYNLQNDFGTNHYTIGLGLANGQPVHADTKIDKSPFYVYAYLPGATNIQQLRSIDSYPQVKDSTGVKRDLQMKYVENHADAFLIGSGDWTLTPQISYSASELAQGNTDSSATLKGISDSTGTRTMTYYASISNPTNYDRTNYTLVADLPTNGKDGSGFNFNLTDQAKVIDPETGQEISDAKIYYLTNYFDVENGNEVKDLLTADQVKSNWSQVRAVVVKLDKLDKQTASRLVLTGEDPTLASDAGKVGNLFSYSKSKNVGPFRITKDSKQDDKNFGSYASILVQSPIVHTAQNAHLIYYNDNSKKFISEDPTTLRFNEASDPNKAYEISYAGEDGDAITLNTNDLDELTSSYKYTYVGLSTENSANLASLKLNTPITKPSKFDFKQLDKDITTGQYFIIHLTKQRKTDQQKAALHFVDDDNNEVEIHKALDVDGNSGTAISFNDPSDENKDVNKIVSELKKKHYDLVKTYDDTNNTQLADEATTDWTHLFGNFDSDSKINQQFIIHFKHHRSDLQNKSVTIHETINYLYGNGPHNGQIAHQQYEATPIIFTGTGYHDDVLGKDIFTGWNKESASFKKVDSPTVKGYHPDQKEIGEKEVTPTSKDINLNVYYYIDGSHDKSIPWTTLTPARKKPQDHEPIPWTTLIPGQKVTNVPWIPLTPTKKPNTGTTYKQKHKQTDSISVTKTIKTNKALINTTNPAQQARKQQTSKLPQTGANSLAALLGISFLGFSSLLGAASRKRKH